MIPMIYDLQKASLLKRISAFILDAILLCVLAAGFALLLSAILGFDSYNQTMTDCREKYEKEYGVSFDISQEEYQALPEAGRKTLDDAYAALSADKDFRYAFNMMLSLTLVILSSSLLLAFLGLEFAVPLLIGNGQTVGKRVFGIALMRTNGVKVSPVCMFIRTLLGKYTIETMIPVLMLIMIYFGTVGILGPAIIGLILLLEIILMLTSHTNSTIHDYLAGTVAVDLSSQMIFGSESELIAYKQRVHAERAAKEKY